MSIRHIIQEPWFQRLDLVYALAVGTVWWFIDHTAGWLALIVVLPWLIRLAVGVFPFERTELNAALFLFMFTAGIGIWAAYNREAAWMKFWVLVGAVGVFLAIARQPRSNFLFTFGLFAWVGAGVALIFLLGHDWRAEPADLAFINRMGVWWMSIRPNIPVPKIHPNVAGGILALLLPYSLAFLFGGAPARNGYPNRLKEWISIGSVAITSGLITLGLLMSSSRAAWAALGLAYIVWLVSQGYQKARTGQDHFMAATQATAILLVTALCAYLALKHPTEILGLADRLPGYSSGASRFELFQNTSRLFGDFAFLGGGLAAFPGLYSQYIMDIPHFLFGYSHSMYLDLAIEQGGFGLLSFLVVLTGSIFLLWRATKNPTRLPVETWLEQAAWVSLAVMTLHGLVDDPLYGVRGTPLIFLAPGISLAIVKAQDDAAVVERKPEAIQSGQVAGLYGLIVMICLFVLALTGGLLLSGRNLRAAWLANLGAVSMARVQLMDFPAGEWKIKPNVSLLEAPRRIFQRALTIDPADRTANHRLGLIAMIERDYESAATYLETAYREDPNNRGIIKVLGFCTAWLGEYDRSFEFLKQIPEAEQELEVYAWWWQSQGLDDLSLKARMMSAHLKAE